MKILPKIFGQNAEARALEMERSLIRLESQIGSELFGPVPAGHRREFFCLDEHTWVWHEEWVAQNGQRQVVTTRYNVRPGGVLKIQGSNGYQPLNRDEARNLYRATELYRQRVGAAYQQMLAA